MKNSKDNQIKIIRECYYNELESLEDEYSEGEITYAEYQRYKRNITNAFEDELRNIEGE